MTAFSTQLPHLHAAGPRGPTAKGHLGLLDTADDGDQGWRQLLRHAFHLDVAARPSAFGLEFLEKLAALVPPPRFNLVCKKG